MIGSLILAVVVATGQATTEPVPSTPPVPVASTPASPSASPTPGASPAPTPMAYPVPAPSPSPTSTATPPASPSPTSSATPYAYRFVPHQPAHPTEDQPQIYAVYLNSNKLRSLGPIAIKVATSANVVRVVTRSNGREGAVPMIAEGDFEATSKLPKIPFIASGISTSIEFIGTTASGKRVVVPVPIVLQ